MGWRNNWMVEKNRSRIMIESGMERGKKNEEALEKQHFYIILYRPDTEV